jgi:hypothetical protein
MDNYPVLFWGNLLLNFVTPFLILMRNDTKRKFGTMFFVAAIVFFGHWWDYFYMIKPGARIAAFEAKELVEGTHGKSHDAAPMSGAKHEEAAKPAEHATEQSASEHATEAAHGDSAVEHTSTDAAHSGGAEEHSAAEASAAPASDHGEGGGRGDAHGGGEATEPNSFRLGFTIPGLEELGVMIGFLSLFIFFLFRQLERASLVPAKDPFLEESLHHETGALIETEQAAQGHDHH